MTSLTVLIPTYNRTTALAATLLSLSYQTYQSFSITIADQSDKEKPFKHSTIKTIIRLLTMREHDVKVLSNTKQQGIAQQRQLLLETVKTKYCLFLDDDIILEPFVVQNMLRAIQEEQCGFVGQALIGLSFLEDIRPNEQHISFWDTPVTKETIRPHDTSWSRYKLHNAANIYHLQTKLKINKNKQKKYKVSWVGGCVLYDTEKLRSVGGFTFWQQLPKNHCGEDVLAQIRVMKQFGGCGLLPSGAYHQETPTTISKRTVNAPEYFF